MKKLFKEKTYDQLEKDYENLKKKNKFLKRRALLIAFFVFAVNAYAWFVYSSDANIGSDASIKGWNLNFYDGNTAVKKLEINPNLYPGMKEYNKTLNIVNSSDVKATISYELKDVTLAGKPIYDSNLSSDEAISFLANSYPFQINFVLDKKVLNEKDSTPFSVKINWPYDGNSYYKVGYSFNYSNDYDYYVYDGNKYIKDTNVTSDNFLNKKDNLYMTKDEIDTYLGSLCSKYQKENNTNCFKFTFNLVAKEKA